MSNDTELSTEDLASVQGGVTDVGSVPGARIYIPAPKPPTPWKDPLPPIPHDPYPVRPPAHIPSIYDISHRFPRL